MDACEQLLQIERLRHVVVGAKLQAANAIVFLAARREHDDRRASSVTQQSAQLEAVLSRQHHVQHDQIRRELPRLGDGEIAVVDRLDVETFEDEVVGQHTRQADVVFDDQDAALHVCQWLHRESERHGRADADGALNRQGSGVVGDDPFDHGQSQAAAAGSRRRVRGRTCG